MTKFYFDNSYQKLLSAIINKSLVQMRINIHHSFHDNILVSADPSELYQCRHCQGNSDHEILSEASSSSSAGN